MMYIYCVRALVITIFEKYFLEIWQKLLPGHSDRHVRFRKYCIVDFDSIRASTKQLYKVTKKRSSMTCLLILIQL